MNYELVCIFSPKIIEKELEKEIKRIEDLLKNIGAKEIEFNNWGKKPLAYKINHFIDGYYAQYDFIIEPSCIEKINQKLKLEEKMVRFLITKREKYAVAKKLENKEEKSEDINLSERKKEVKKKHEEKKPKKGDFDKKLNEVLNKDIY